MLIVNEATELKQKDHNAFSSSFLKSLIEWGYFF
jgi:hypothetical protein